MTKRTKKILLVVCVSVVAITVVLMAIARFATLWNAEVFIFSNIDECKAIENRSGETVSFTKFQDATQDDCLQGLSYISFYAGKYSSDQLKFELFAYEFDDVASSRSYFENITGKDTEQMEQNFSISSGMITARIVAYSNNHAYAVYCPTNNLPNVMQILEELFTVKIK